MHSASRSARSSARVYLMQRHMPGPDDPAPRFSLKIEDRHWYWLYLPIARLTEFVSVEDRAAAAGPHQHLPALQLPDPDRAAGVRPLSRYATDSRHGRRPGIAFQILQSVFVVLVAPLLMGWVEPVPRLAAEPIGAEHPAAVPHAGQAVPQGRGDRAQRLAVVSRHALHPVRLHVARRRHRAGARDRPAVRAGGRHHRAGGRVRAGARVLGARGDGHRHRLRRARRAARDADRLPRRAGDADDRCSPPRSSAARPSSPPSSRRWRTASSRSIRAWRSRRSPSSWCCSPRTRASRSTTRPRTSSSP